jgi:hypothetical protein
MRKSRPTPLFLAGAAAVAVLTVFSAARPVAPFATDDTSFVNDQGQTSGDVFTQNAQSQGGT